MGVLVVVGSLFGADTAFAVELVVEKAASALPASVIGGGVTPQRFSRMPITWSTFVAKRLSDVRIPPLGPRLYCFITSL